MNIPCMEEELRALPPGTVRHTNSYEFDVLYVFLHREVNFLRPTKGPPWPTNLLKYLHKTHIGGAERRHAPPKAGRCVFYAGILTTWRALQSGWWGLKKLTSICKNTYRITIL